MEQRDAAADVLDDETLQAPGGARAAERPCSAGQRVWRDGGGRRPARAPRGRGAEPRRRRPARPGGAGARAAPSRGTPAGSSGAGGWVVDRTSAVRAGGEAVDAAVGVGAGHRPGRGDGPAAQGGFSSPAPPRRRGSHGEAAKSVPAVVLGARTGAAKSARRGTRAANDVAACARGGAPPAVAGVHGGRHHATGQPIDAQTGAAGLLRPDVGKRFSGACRPRPRRLLAQAAGDQLGVGAAARRAARRGCRARRSPVVDHDDLVGVPDGGEAVGDRDGGAPTERRSRASCTARSVRVSSALVASSSTSTGGSRNTSGRSRAAGAHRRRSGSRARRRRCRTRPAGSRGGRGSARRARRRASRRRSRRVGEPQVLGDRRVEQVGLLRDTPTSRVSSEEKAAQVVAIDRDLPGDVVEPGHEVSQGGLAGARRPDDRERGPGRDLQRHVPTTGPLARRSEGDVRGAPRRRARADRGRVGGLGEVDRRVEVVEDPVNSAASSAVDATLSSVRIGISSRVCRVVNATSVPIVTTRPAAIASPANQYTSAGITAKLICTVAIRQRPAMRERTSRSARSPDSARSAARDRRSGPSCWRAGCRRSTRSPRRGGHVGHPALLRRRDLPSLRADAAREPDEERQQHEGGERQAPVEEEHRDDVASTVVTRRRSASPSW